MRELLPPIFAAIFGAVIGSFLNACIYRMPRGISLSNPKRSFCTTCQRLIPWYENLPIISWLALRGKCAGCGSRISPRYLLVELLTALAFYAAWVHVGFPVGFAYCIFMALLITATFIDIEFFIIPDEITIGGTAAGIIFSLIIPELMQTSSRLTALGLSMGGAALGYGLLWLIVEFGKLAFGKKKHVFPKEEPFVWIREGETASVKIGEDVLAWDDLFGYRASDELVLNCSTFEMGERKGTDTTLRFHFDKVRIGDEEFNLDDLDAISGSVRSVVIPREAMGFGDVKFIACIGAFLGWQAVLFTICSASVIGCVAAVGGLFMARDKSGSRVPFGPFLALGAALWVFYGEKIWIWYFGMFQGNDQSLL
ncbi:hypothetical protein BH09VER1_BH09VER1_40460 [soil metagenome]